MKELEEMNELPTLTAVEGATVVVMLFTDPLTGALEFSSSIFCDLFCPYFYFFFLPQQIRLIVSKSIVWQCSTS